MHANAFDSIPSGERAQTSSLPLTCTPELSVCGCDCSGVQVYRISRMLGRYLHGGRPLSLGHFSDFLTMSCCAPSNFVSGLRLRTGHTSWLDLIQVIGPHLRFGWSRIQGLASPALSLSERGRVKTRRKFNTRTDKVQSPPSSLPPSLCFNHQTFAGMQPKEFFRLQSSAWPVLRRLPWPRRFLAKTIRGPEPGAHVLEPLPLTRILGSPTDVSLRSLLSFFVFLYLSVCEASKLRSLPFTHPIYVASRYFQ